MNEPARVVRVIVRAHACACLGAHACEMFMCAHVGVFVRMCVCVCVGGGSELTPAQHSLKSQRQD
jgi:hypothetical protein